MNKMKDEFLFKDMLISKNKKKYGTIIRLKEGDVKMQVEKISKEEAIEFLSIDGHKNTDRLKEMLTDESGSSLSRVKDIFIFSYLNEDEDISYIGLIKFNNNTTIIVDEIYLAEEEENGLNKTVSVMATPIAIALFADAVATITATECKYSTSGEAPSIETIFEAIKNMSIEYRLFNNKQ